MLEEFRVENFMNFRHPLVLKLNGVRNYNFGSEAVRNQIVKTGLIYGRNGSGKSALGLAITDLSRHLTDSQKNSSTQKQYLCLPKDEVSRFYYKFNFFNVSLVYRYEKNAEQRILQEELWIDNERLIYYNFLTQESDVKVSGSEVLCENFTEENSSFLKYIINNVEPSNNVNELILEKFLEFVENMHFFSQSEKALEEAGKDNGRSIAKKIIESGKLHEFQRLLESLGIEYALLEHKLEGAPLILCDFNGKKINFFDIASSGMYSLALFYHKWIEFENASFIFMDGWDAFLDNGLIRLLISEILKSDVQVLLTAHNTSIIDNDLLRPDCYFNLVNGSIVSFADSTDKELRKAHNIENLYRSGSFNG